MKHQLFSIISLVLGISLNGGCMSEPTDHMSIEEQITLSPEHRVMPYHIARLSDGDLLIFGANNQLDFRPWAMRVSPAGQARWEYLQGDGNCWNDRSEKGQRYDSFIELPDRTTLLCGIKVENWKRSILLDHLGVDGTLINERILQPDSATYSLTGSRCIQWKDGIALLGGVSGNPRGTGWLAQLDRHLNIQWQKFGDQFVAAHTLQAPEGAVFYLNGALIDSKGNSVMSVVKLGSTDQPLALHTFPLEDVANFVYPDVPKSSLSFILRKSDLDSELVEFDEQFRGPTRVINLHNAGLRKCLQLPDGSFAIFGSQYQKSATAAVIRVYNTGNYHVFLVEPPYQSGWYYDAAFLGGDRSFAATRLVDDGRAVLDWVAFK